MKRNYAENSLKRFLKGKVKITLGLIVTFMIAGNVSYGYSELWIKPGTYDEFLDKEPGNLLIFDGGTFDYKFNGGASITGAGNADTAIVIGNSPAQVNITVGEGKDFIVNVPSSYGAIRIDDNSHLSIEGGKLKFAGGADSEKVSPINEIIHVGANLKINSESMYVGIYKDDNPNRQGQLGIKLEGGIADINLKKDFVADVAEGIYAMSHSNFSLSTTEGNITINATNLTTDGVNFGDKNWNYWNENNYVGFGIYAKSAKNIDLTAEKGDITIDSIKETIYSTGKTPVKLTAEKGQIALTSIAGFSVVKAQSGSTVDLKASEIILTGNNDKVKNDTLKANPTDDYAVISSNGSTVNLEADKITISSANNTGDTRKNIAVSSKGGSNVTFKGSTSILSDEGIALYALDKDSAIKLSEVGNHKVIGHIIADGKTEIDIEGKENVIGNEKAEIVSANDGAINLTGKIVTGRVDNYIGYTKGDFGKDTFRDNDFYTDVKGEGTINIALDDNGTWNVQGQSFLNKLSGNNKTVDLSGATGSSIEIETLEGQGTFVMALDSQAVNNKDIASNMLYIKDIANDSLDQNVNLINVDKVLGLKDGEKLRFATVGGTNRENVNFTVSEVKGRGIRNVSFEVGQEKYDTNSSVNENYNGSTETELKPGNEFVNDIFGNGGENYYISKNGGGDPGKDPDTEISKSIVSMFKGNYSSAVYMDNLNKRLGDMSFVDGTEGLWVRTRNDRVGEDKDYRLRNYMTQIGYDKKYPMDNGDEYRGIAFEYSQGEMEYKEFSGNSTMDKWLVSLYDTKVYNSGVYSDYILKAGKIYSELDMYAETNVNGVDNEKVNVTGKYNTLFLGAGAEFGRKYTFNENSYFEPQVQLQYTYIDDADYTTNQNTKVKYGDIHSLIGRAGFRLGYDFYKENSKENTVYVKADINHEFLGDQKVEATDVTGTLDKTYHNDETWYDIGIGVAKKITPDFNVYMDVEKQFGTAKDNNSWQFNLGFRYRFGGKAEQTQPKLTPVTKMITSLKADNYFDFDKSELKPEGKAVIKETAEIINKENLQGTILIEGHTDSKGTEEYNQKLSERRAEAVETELKNNINSENIKYETKGYGESQPIADNTTEEGRAQNRRVEIKYENR